MVETAWTWLVLRRIQETKLEMLSPIAHEVYPLSLITSYALCTTCLWSSFQHSSSLSVPTCLFISRSLTPATFTPDHTGTEHYKLLLPKSIVFIPEPLLHNPLRFIFIFIRFTFVIVQLLDFQTRNCKFATNWDWLRGKSPSFCV